MDNCFVVARSGFREQVLIHAGVGTVVMDREFDDVVGVERFLNSVNEKSYNIMALNDFIDGPVVIGWLVSNV